VEQEEILRRELLTEVESIAPILAEHAPLSEKLGRVDDASFEAMRGTRLPQCVCPRALGGLEAGPVTGMEIYEAVARIDGSAGWVLGILAGSSAIVASMLPAASARRICANGIPPMAGAVAPAGTAEPVAGGYKVKSRSSFGSGIHHAQWVFATVLVAGQPPPAGMRVVVVPRNQVVIHDNWEVAGLRGSGSCDYSLEDVVVPEEMTFSLLDFILGNVATPAPVLKLGSPANLAIFHMGIALGIARRALDEITSQAVAKGRGLPPSPLPTHPHFQFALGKAEVELASARALAIQLLSSLYAEVQAGRVPPPARHAEARAAATYVTEVAQRVTGVAFQAAGGGGLFDTNPLQRCFRDVYAAGQHFVVSQSAYRALGQFKLGQPEANPML
jgi:alkylation response protein AidB-like acyl-CoA dehydrogenase